jgi:hypothetical protein
LDRLVRSSDPHLRKMLESEIRQVTSGAGKHFRFQLTDPELHEFVRTYGEQFVSNPTTDLDQYFDVVNRRFFTRSIPTQLAVLYLFGSGKQYRASVSALSAAGEAVAGYCMEKFGYRPLVRPLGVMPDAVLWTVRNGGFHLALTEAKASTTRDPGGLVEQNVFQFFVDIKTRATGFRYPYDGYLVCTTFADGHHVDCMVLQVGLGYYNRGTANASRLDPPQGFSAVASYEDPDARLRTVIRLQAETSAARDEYLTSVLSEEASRSATMAMIKRGKPLEAPADVQNYVDKAAREVGLENEWKLGQSLISDTKRAEKERVQTAIQRYKASDKDLEH